jgi:hypothetical protein
VLSDSPFVMALALAINDSRKVPVVVLTASFS